MNKLNTEELTHQMESLDQHWDISYGFLARDFEFKDFVQAFEFMKKVAVIAEEHNHHPNWENVYNHLLIRLRTHDADGITVKDISLAKEIDRIFNEQ